MPALDQPLSYIQWLRETDTATVPDSTLFETYNKYLLAWFSDKNDATLTFTEFRTNLFVNLLKEKLIWEIKQRLISSSHFSLSG